MSRARLVGTVILCQPPRAPPARARALLAPPMV